MTQGWWRGAVALVVTLGGAVPGMTAAAQGTQRVSTKQEIVPREYMPPAKMCRVWIDGVPPAQQPAPTDCATAVQKKPANGRVIYGEDANRAAPAGRGAPLVPPDIEPVDPRALRAEREKRRISDDQLFGDPSAAAAAGAAAGQAAGQAGGQATTGAVAGAVAGQGILGDPRYFNSATGVKPPGYGSATCLDRDGDGWCDDSRFGPPVCLDKDKDGRCDDLPEYASKAYPQTLPPMRAVLDVAQGRPNTEVMTWLGTNEFQLRIPDQGRGGVPWRAIFLDQAGSLLQIWTDSNRDGRADRIEIFQNGQRVKMIQR